MTFASAIAAFAAGSALAMANDRNFRGALIAGCIVALALAYALTVDRHNERGEPVPCVCEGGAP